MKMKIIFCLDMAYKTLLSSKSKPCLKLCKQLKQNLGRFEASKSGDIQYHDNESDQLSSWMHHCKDVFFSFPVDPFFTLKTILNIGVLLETNKLNFQNCISEKNLVTKGFFILKVVSNFEFIHFLEIDFSWTRANNFIRTKSVWVNSV